LTESGYEVDHVLGCGFFGIVLLAKNITTKAKVAIKMKYFENNK